MPAIVSVATALPPYTMTQQKTRQLVYDLFSPAFSQIDRLIQVFDHSGIHERQFMAPESWYLEAHTFAEKNELYVSESVNLGVSAVRACMVEAEKKSGWQTGDVDAFIFVSSSGISTPTIDAKIMNQLPFSPHVTRLPIWGLGCAGGAAGLSRAHEYCLARPDAKVLLLSIEGCSLTFAKDDFSKSNLVGTSLFGDGAACALIAGDEALNSSVRSSGALPYIRDTRSTFMPDSEDIMGWDLQDDGLHVIFSRHIPSVIERWLKPDVTSFLEKSGVALTDIHAFVAHPGGKKVLQAYEASLGFSERDTAISRQVLRNHGNMSSPTILYVLQAFMAEGIKAGHKGLAAALGPGFCSELLLLEWRDVT